MAKTKTPRATRKNTAAGTKTAVERRPDGIQSIRRACEVLETVARSPDGMDEVLRTLREAKLIK